MQHADTVMTLTQKSMCCKWHLLLTPGCRPSIACAGTSMEMLQGQVRSVRWYAGADIHLQSCPHSICTRRPKCQKPAVPQHPPQTLSRHPCQPHRWQPNSSKWPWGCPKQPCHSQFCPSNPCRAVSEWQPPFQTCPFTPGSLRPSHGSSQTYTADRACCSRWQPHIFLCLVMSLLCTPSVHCWLS